MNRPTCPECNSTDVAGILYGAPFLNVELERMMRDGKIVLGGTTSGGFDSPQWQCNFCGARWRETGAAPAQPPIQGQAESEPS